MKIANIQTFKMDLRLKEPSVISYKTVNYVRNVLVIIRTNDGLVGIGESSPLKPVTQDTREEALQFLKLANASLKDEDPCNIASIHYLLAKLTETLGFTSQTAKAAIDSACYDILGKIKKKPIYQLLSNTKPNFIPNTVTIYLGSIDETTRKTSYLMKKYSKNKLQRIKLKLSGNPRLDKQRVHTVAKIFPGELTLDANQAYRDEKLAVSVFNDIYDALGSKVILVEQPSPKDDLYKLKWISDRCRIPVFADESVVTLNDLQEVIKRKSAAGVNIKLQKAGGIFWGMKMAELARKSRISLMVGSVLEGGIGIAQAAHYLAGISSDVVAADLDTDLGINTKVIKERSKVPFRGGARIPLDNPGLGIELRRDSFNLLKKS